MKLPKQKIAIAVSLSEDYKTFLVGESPNIAQLVGFPTLLGIFFRNNPFDLVIMSILMWGILLLPYIQYKGYKHLTSLWDNGMSTPYAYSKHRSFIIKTWFIYTLIASILLAIIIPLVIISNIPES